VNSSHYRLVSYTPAFSDRRSLEITLAPIGFHDYYTLIPFLDEPLLQKVDGAKTSIREKYGHTALTYRASGDTRLVPAPVSLQCVIVTKDHQILLMQRASSVAFYPGHWSASFEETMDAPGLSPKGNIRSGDADFFACAIRGLEEEFGVAADAVESIKILSLNLEYLILAVGVVAIINLNLTAQEVKTHWLVKAPDKDEASKFATVSVDLSSIVEKLFSRDVLWHPTSRMRLIQFLFHIYGVDEVENTIKAR
jgi:isopentenyldiphosphate isomerase